MKVIRKLFSWNEIQSSHRLMLLMILVLGLLNFFWGEIVPAGGGFGWDGVYYAEMVRNLDTMISEGQLSSYYTQRILPSAIIRGMLLLSGAAISDVNIIRAFELYNLTLLVGACWVWKRVSNRFSLSLAGRWIGFSGIFINFACSKQAFYYPVLTDVTALLVGTLLLLFYIEKKSIALFITTIIGAFCWPVVSVSGALLLIFLHSNLSKGVIDPVNSSRFIRSTKPTYPIKLAFLTILILTIILHLIFFQFNPISKSSCDKFNEQLISLASMLPDSAGPLFQRMLNVKNNCVLEKLLITPEQLLTALPSIFGLLVALAMLLGSAPLFKEAFAIFKKTRIPLIVLAISAVIIPTVLIRIISNPDINNVSGLMLLVRLIIFPPAGKVLMPIVTLAVFWGPLVLLLVIYWDEFCSQARRLGLGFVAIIAISLPLGIVGEPRFMTVVWPFLVFGLVLVFENSSTKVSFKYVLIALSVIYAQFWLRLNYVSWLPPDSDGLLEFPKQLYFMHYGLWMSWLSYFVQIPVLIISAILIRNSIIRVGK